MLARPRLVSFGALLRRPHKAALPLCRAFLGSLLILLPPAGYPNPAFSSSDPGAARHQLRLPTFAIEGNTLISTDTLLAALEPLRADAGNAVAACDAQVASAARDAVLQRYREAGREMVSVRVSELAGPGCVLLVRVYEATIGRIEISGNEHASDTSLLGSVPELREGHNPDFRRLSRQLFLANDNPSRQLRLDFAPGEPGRADVTIAVRDEAALKLALSLDNSGNVATGRTRSALILAHTDLWERGHELVASYTTSVQHPDRARTIGLAYQIPLPTLGDRVQLSYAWSNSNAGRVADAFDVAGQGSIFGVRYLRWLARDSFSEHSIEAGLESKRYRNTIDFFGVNLGVDVDARPLVLGWQARYRGPELNLAAGLGHVRNLPGGTRNDDARYAASRAGARAAWRLWRVHLDARIGAASGWNLHLALDGQSSSEPLISAEQFGIGGLRSVRGFGERESSGDRGWRLSQELASPPVVGKHRFVGFIDGGRQRRLQALPGEARGDTLLSVGLGWRWLHRMTGARSLSSSLDWAHVRNGTPATPAGENALHLSAIWRFI